MENAIFYTAASYGGVLKAPIKMLEIYFVPLPDTRQQHPAVRECGCCLLVMVVSKQPGLMQDNAGNRRPNTRYPQLRKLWPVASGAECCDTSETESWPSLDTSPSPPHLLDPAGAWTGVTCPHTGVTVSSVCSV